MPEFVGFETIVILDTKCMNIDAVGVFGPAFRLLFKSNLSYCDVKFYHQRDLEPMHSFDGNPEVDGENKGFEINPKIHCHFFIQTGPSTVRFGKNGDPAKKR